MNIRFAVVAAAVALALPATAADFQVGTGTTFSISGFFGLGLKQSSISNTTRVGVKDELRVDDNTSRIFFSGTTKVADGYTLVYQVGSRFTTDVRPTDSGVGTIPAGQITGWADDDTWAGIATPYGRFIFGKNSFYWPDTIGLPHLAGALDAPGECYRIWDANGLGTFNILNQTPVVTKTGLISNTYVLGITRSRNVFRYDSPNFSGFDFALVWSKNPIGDEVKYPGAATPGPVGATTYASSYSDGQTIYGRARYNKDGIVLHASFLDQKIMGGTYTPATFNGPLDTKAFRLGGGYKFPFGLKVGLVFDSTEIDNGVGLGVPATWGGSVGSSKRTAFEVPLSYTMGDHMFHLTYGVAGSMSGTQDTGAKQLNLVWDYALTKKTFVGLYLTKLDNDKYGHYAPFLAGTNFGSSAPNPLGTNGENFTQLGFNVQFWF